MVNVLNVEPNDFVINVLNVEPNDFVTRQLPKSSYSCAVNMSFQEVADLIHVGEVSEGYKPASYEQGGRVIVVRLPEGLAKNFRSGITIIREGEEVIEGFRSRVEGEDPRPFREVIRAEKPVAKTVDLIFYNAIALAQDGDNTLEERADNWELVSINASEDECMDPPPITPEALKANYLNLDGGTKTSMTGKEYELEMQKSTAYWENRATIRLVKN